MNTIKKLLGLVWMLLGPSVVIFMFMQAMDKISKAAEGVAKTNTTLQWSIILVIFIPVCIGLVIFGYYAWKGEYEHLPENSNEI
jgi:ABC-type glycerol-3-phosphate transport system permease component